MPLGQNPLLKRPVEELDFTAVLMLVEVLAID
jgi:hypothetical protein